MRVRKEREGEIVRERVREREEERERERREGLSRQCIIYFKAFSIQ